MKKFIGTLCVTSALASSAYARSVMDTIVVTATREEQSKGNIAESVDVMNGDEIESISPSHPAEVLNRIAGVHINNLGGEGHMTSIRQPLTTSGVYLFLEDGLPTRPTGFFNHNGLYEINIPQAERLEVTKGPGSSLYGSDAIGGVINSITKAPSQKQEIEINPEYGSYGWKRLLVSESAPINANNGFRIDLNLTDNDGYRDDSAYSRYSTTGRLDSLVGDNTSVKTIFSYNTVDQSGVSSLESADYRNNPRKNFYHGDIAKREVEALRLSTEIAYEPDNTNLYTLTPFFRDNHMSLMPSWMISYDPNIYDVNFQSYGAMAKYRRKLSAGEIITGVDADYTPSTYIEKDITVSQTNGIYTDYSYTGTTHYDFSADQTSISPYIHGEWNIQPKVIVSGGLRYDYFNVDYQNNLSTLTTGSHRRAASESISYDHLSPKLGLVYKYREKHDAYANYRHAFRVPSIGQLFRSGSSVNTTDLEPVKTDSFEIGLRGQFWDWLNYDTSIYHMIVQDDIVSLVDVSDRKVVNAGKTSHQGIEVALNGDITEEWNFRTAWTYTNQKYDSFQAIVGFPASTISYDGNDIARAPKTIGNFAIGYKPEQLTGTKFEIEWEHLGKYYTDETNANKYGGHDLFNFRAGYDVTKNVELYGRVMNITDKLYSTSTTNQVGDPDTQFMPGNPRTFYAGVRAKF